uniref:Uncharacterized protein n=1 Tax=Anopheles minimus TaxID=112268 RepID=A0A182WN46_9DIPT
CKPFGDRSVPVKALVISIPLTDRVYGDVISQRMLQCEKAYRTTLMKESLR